MSILTQLMQTEGTTLYAALVAANIPVRSHSSDLYFPATPEALAILDKYPLEKSNSQGRGFTNQVEGGRWVDVPFAYMPFWDDIAKKCEAIREAAQEKQG